VDFPESYGNSIFWRSVGPTGPNRSLERGGYSLSLPRFSSLGDQYLRSYGRLKFSEKIEKNPKSSLKQILLRSPQNRNLRENSWCFKKKFMSNGPTLWKISSVTRVVSTNTIDTDRNPDANQTGDSDSNSEAFNAGLARGLKKLRFVFVDTPSDVKEMEPYSYTAIIKNASGFLLMCSFDQAESLKYLDEKVQDINRTHKHGTIPLILVANKSDIEEEERSLEEDDVRKKATELHIKCCFTSLASPEGCEEMSGMLLNEINQFAEKDEFQAAETEDLAYIDEDGY
jgi:GTPase SAR1 family protein